MRRSLCVFVPILLCLAIQSKAKTTNWISPLINGSPTNWNSAYNWDNGVPVDGDNVQIGVTSVYFGSPVLPASITLNSLTFGVSSSGTLTINSGVILTVTNNITVKYASTSATIGIAQTVVGGVGATINCGGSFLVGDGTLPNTPAVLGTFQATNTATVNLSVQNFNVGGSLIMNTTSRTGNITLLSVTISSNVNNPVLNINNGSLNISQNIQTTNTAYVSTAISGYPTATNSALLTVNPSGNTAGSTPALGFGGTISVSTGGALDFYGPGVGSTSTLNYIGANAQAVYLTAPTGVDASPYLYQNLGFSGAGVKTIPAGTLNLPGNWSSAGGRVDALTNSTIIRFVGAAQTLTDGGSNSGAGFSFGNVYFEGTGTKTISSGKFSVAGSGVLNMVGTTTLAVGASGTLTLLSTTSGSATVAPVPSGAAITGNVNVQRLMKGSPTNLTKRGYRFISSAVYSATVNGFKCFDVKYLLDSTYVSGMSGGGFNAPSTNPSLYLYRQDIVSSNASFTSGNFKGIARINNTPTYNIGTQKQFTTANTDDTTMTIPVGNGLLYFFRGNKTDNATQTGTKVTTPYDYPEDVAVTQIGQLNTGTITVKPWYKYDDTNNPNAFLPYTKIAALNNAKSRGYVLVGNPYASTINWEKFNRKGANSDIYGGGATADSTMSAKIWMYNPTTKQYDTYMQTPTIASPNDTINTINPTGSIQTGDASNMIASGQGFFIRVNSTKQNLIFRESAKTTTQPVAANLMRVFNAYTPAAVQTSPMAILSFRLSKDSVNTDDAVLALNNKTENTFNLTEDAEDLNGNGALVSLSIISSDNIATAIKKAKLPQSGNQTIKLFADATTSGTYELKLRKLESLPAAYNVWLKDAFTNDSLDIKNNNTYAFNIDKSNAATFGANRFKIVVSRNQALAMRPLSFNAEKTAQGAKLTWSTENERTDYMFVIERSTDDGKTFKELAQQRSDGSGNYTLLDVQPILGENKYRVKVLDVATNNLNQTLLARVNFAEANIKAAKVSVYPNPATTTVNIKMDVADADKNNYAIKISNSMGMVVKEISSSQPNLQENISGLLPGTYLVKVVNTTANKVQGETKFVKLN